jgi:hypothetical protein
MAQAVRMWPAGIILAAVGALLNKLSIRSENFSSRNFLCHGKFILFYFIFTLLYFIFYFVLFYFLLYFILFYTLFHFILFFILFYFTLFILLYFILFLFYFILFCLILFYFLLRFILFYFILYLILFHFLFYFIFCTVHPVTVHRVKIDKRVPSTATNIISSVNVCFMPRSLLNILEH